AHAAVRHLINNFGSIIIKRLIVSGLTNIDDDLRGANSGERLQYHLDSVLNRRRFTVYVVHDNDEAMRMISVVFCLDVFNQSGDIEASISRISNYPFP